MVGYGPVKINIIGITCSVRERIGFIRHMTGIGGSSKLGTELSGSIKGTETFPRDR